MQEGSVSGADLKPNAVELSTGVSYRHRAVLKSENHTEVALREGAKLMRCSTFLPQEIVGHLARWTESKSQALSHLTQEPLTQT